MDREQEDLRRIRENADLVVAQLGAESGLERFGFDAPSVAWVEGFIERQRVREDASPELVERLVSVLGSYLGECVVRSHGGRWSCGDDGWCVAFDEKNAVFPFAKVRKQFAHGKDGGDGVHGFFTMIPLVFFAGAEQAEPAGWFARISRWFTKEDSK